MPQSVGGTSAINVRRRPPAPFCGQGRSGSQSTPNHERVGAAFAAHDKAIMDEAISRRDESLANISVFGLGKKPLPRNS
jgi:hypothetical protein